jgi:hypothetical protein
MEEFIAKDNPVRFIDAFVEQLELSKLGFIVSKIKIEGFLIPKTSNFSKFSLVLFLMKN